MGIFQRRHRIHGNSGILHGIQRFLPGFTDHGFIISVGNQDKALLRITALIALQSRDTVNDRIVQGRIIVVRNQSVYPPPDLFLVREELRDLQRSSQFPHHHIVVAFQALADSVQHILRLSHLFIVHGTGHIHQTVKGNTLLLLPYGSDIGNFYRLSADGRRKKLRFDLLPCRGFQIRAINLYLSIFRPVSLQKCVQACGQACRHGQIPDADRRTQRTQQTHSLPMLSSSLHLLHLQNDRHGRIVIISLAKALPGFFSQGIHPLLRRFRSGKRLFHLFIPEIFPKSVRA